MLTVWRQEEGGAENGVRDLLNYLLKNAIKTADLELPVGTFSWTTIRHTAFCLTLEEFPTFGQAGSIKKFAFNGHKSEQMLRQTYLNYIENDQLGDIARETIKAGSTRWFGWLMQVINDLLSWLFIS